MASCNDWPWRGALYRGRELLVLDEPTSALGARSDRLLLNELPTLLAGRTCVLISHRFWNVRQADQIFVFNDGRVVERGTHDELMAERGLYAEMYSLQASAFTTEQQSLVGEK
ncbi:ATP-binding cassette, subfamily B [Amycolatopsis arida]|uniref:ATP-binding cassette, subfamily B n=1 Tax=Amycolatopsis arida TaxID=587909 RepID=A0A1I6B1J8_9PSEU|nr:hypothetical protein [Amycolatopsis arida]TDX83568.1 hypothetical protein CLV69_1191 [Amycolatopsis arida]SFQ74769.1 ATP-binding cassette, subfamily B [Amycolatopsis arida]